MKRWIIVIVPLVLVCAMCFSPVFGQGTSVIPMPQRVDVGEEGVFVWRLTSVVSMPEDVGRTAMAAYSEWVRSRAWPETGWLDETTGTGITGEYDAGVSGPEAYRLTVDRDGILIRASAPAGFFYGVKTVIQILEEYLDGARAILPAMEIEDAPAFGYRGMHLDVCRHFFPLDSVKKYVDWMARYKFNAFHWHLTEDQGWRLEVERFPLLQEVAAYRDETLIGHFGEKEPRYDGQRYGGYYTQEEVRELVRYAAERHVEVIPEIEMPGHARAALAAYPHLSCSGDSLPVATTWGVFEEVFCTKEETFDFLYGVLEEVIALFPGRYIHIGGDECPKAAWKACATCQANIERYGLADEHALQSWFIGRIDTFLTARGKTLIGWDEILEGGLADNATVMSWRGTKGAIEAARMGHPVIMTPTSHCYFDYYQSEDPGEPLAIGGLLPVEKVYAFDPIPDVLTGSQRDLVLGAQGNVWTEYIPDYDHVEYMVFPRMMALAEVVWTGDDRPGFDDFARRVRGHYEVLDLHGVDYRPLDER
jgi:hexosaminidase